MTAGKNEPKIQPLPDPDFMKEKLNRVKDQNKINRINNERLEKLAIKEQRNADAAQVLEKQLQESKSLSRSTKQGDWYSIMIALFENMSLHAKALHANSFAKQVTDAITKPLGVIINSAGGWLTESAHLNMNSFLEWSGLKKEEPVPDFSFGVKLDDKGHFTCATKVNGSIALKDYFRDENQEHTMSYNRPEKAFAAEIADMFEANFQCAFERWLLSKGCKINTDKDNTSNLTDFNSHVINDASGKVLTKKELENLNNQGNPTLAEFLSNETKLNVKLAQNILSDDDTLVPGSTLKP